MQWIFELGMISRVMELLPHDPPPVQYEAIYSVLESNALSAIFAIVRHNPLFYVKSMLRCFHQCVGPNMSFVRFCWVQLYRVMTANSTISANTNLGNANKENKDPIQSINEWKKEILQIVTKCWQLPGHGSSGTGNKTAMSHWVGAIDATMLHEGVHMLFEILRNDVMEVRLEACK